RAALWMRLGEMMPVNGSAVADDFSQNFRAAPACAFERFEIDNRRAFAQRQTIAPSVERTANGRRERLQRIEAGENQFTERVIAASHHAFGLTAANQIKCVADGVAAGSAGARDDGGRPAATERVENHPRLNLRLILNGTGGLAAMPLRLLHRLPVIRFAEGHAAGGRAKNERQLFGGLPAGLLPRFVRGQQEHFSGAIQPGELTAVELRRRKISWQVHFRRDFYTLAADIKQRHRSKRPSSGAETFRVQRPAQTERRDNARAGNDHSRWCDGRWC